LEGKISWGCGNTWANGTGHTSQLFIYGFFHENRHFFEVFGNLGFRVPIWKSQFYSLILNFFFKESEQVIL
jgi:hypothetical protein